MCVYVHMCVPEIPELRRLKSKHQESDVVLGYRRLFQVIGFCYVIVFMFVVF